MEQSKLRYRSNNYVTLCYAKMIAEPFSKARVRSCLSGMWKEENIKELKRSLYTLTKAGFLEKIKDDEWVITPLGEFTIFQTAKQSKENNRGFRVNDYISQPQKSRARVR